MPRWRGVWQEQSQRECGSAAALAQTDACLDNPNAHREGKRPASSLHRMEFNPALEPEAPNSPNNRPGHPSVPSWLLFGVFTVSGISALLYQLVWQRALLTLYGSNVESVAMVVTAFMLGLGLGSLAGGALSKKAGVPLVLVFCLAELGIGLYGLFSLRLFHLVGQFTLGVGAVPTGLLAFALVFIPTLLMGATLPLLVAHQVKETSSVGKSVSWLYFVNTLGAAAGAFLAAFFVLGSVGLSGAVRTGAVLNGLAALTILAAWLRRRP
jgi:predicted membrane-bound spermidine synthase